MGELSNRRLKTAARISQIQSRLKSAEAVAANKACVYVTGSFGRGDASEFSDLDLFIVGKNGQRRINGRLPSKLTQLDDVLLKAKLIETSRELKFPEFSGDGKYLIHYSVHDLTKTLGTPNDDIANTFTARLLLLLESKPLVEADVYKDVIHEVIDAYWQDFSDHRTSFIPAFLANDILRLWRTLCVNYEARTARVPEIKKAKRKIANYKLKHSRLLTCYSGLLFLLATFRKNRTVTPRDALMMVQLTPTERLEWLAENRNFKAVAQSTLRLYEGFLRTTNAPESELIEMFMNREAARNYMLGAARFGDSVFRLMQRVGAGTNFYRLLVV